MQTIPLMLLISVLLFSLLHAAPGGPLTKYLEDPRIRQVDIDRISHNLGLDRPVYVQYFSWLGKTLHGDLGYSDSNQEDVSKAMLDRLPATLELMVTSIVISAVLGITFGIVAAVRPYGFWDYAVTTFAFFGQSMPVFWFASLLQFFLAVRGFEAFGYRFSLPSSGQAYDTHDFHFGDYAEHLIMPAIVLCLLNLAVFSRFTRSSMLEVIKTDFIRTARAKGVGALTIIRHHALRNALVPVVTIAALILPTTIGGAVVTERIFSWPGMGRMFFDALGKFDFELLMAYLLVNAVLVVACNLLADIGYSLLDPRVRYD